MSYDPPEPFLGGSSSNSGISNGTLYLLPPTITAATTYLKIGSDRDLIKQGLENVIKGLFNEDVTKWESASDLVKLIFEFYEGGKLSSALGKEEINNLVSKITSDIISGKDFSLYNHPALASAYSFIRSLLCSQLLGGIMSIAARAIARWRNWNEESAEKWGRRIGYVTGWAIDEAYNLYTLDRIRDIILNYINTDAAKNQIRNAIVNALEKNLSGFIYDTEIYNALMNSKYSLKIGAKLPYIFGKIAEFFGRIFHTNVDFGTTMNYYVGETLGLLITFFITYGGMIAIAKYMWGDSFSIKEFLKETFKPLYLPFVKLKEKLMR